MENNSLLKNAELYATDILKNQLSPDLVFHNFDYTKKVVEMVQAIGTHEQLSNEEMEMAQIAAWFHGTGYRDAYNGHEEKSIAIASAFLSEEKVPTEKIDKILDSILATQVGNPLKHNIGKVLADAGKTAVKEGDFKVQLDRLRQELLAVKKIEQSEVECLQNYLETILKYEFHTAYGKEVLLPARDKLKVKLERRLNKLQKVVDESLSSGLGVTAAQLKAMKKKLQKAEGRPERGIETMFRLTSKNHLDLSGMADSKANIMISINSIIMSVVLGSMMQKLDSNVHLVLPTIILLAVNLASLIFAILSLRPNVSDGLFTRDDIENQRTNLLFFGNFHKMTREDYHWGMNKLMENANFLYSNLIDDIYFLGVVLARKYKLLRTSYNIFMFGMVVVVIAYVISLSFAEEPVKSVINTLRE
ncbi:MAG: hypothetical protein DHS20C18_20500 [Saprospiraceae bacterium]|nr:MAG: hypothetical protein DHS20C18_20500 [Saprospiraceae bacterium]